MGDRRLGGPGFQPIAGFAQVIAAVQRQLDLGQRREGADFLGGHRPACREVDGALQGIGGGRGVAPAQLEIADEGVRGDVLIVGFDGPFRVPQRPGVVAIVPGKSRLAEQRVNAAGFTLERGFVVGASPGRLLLGGVGVCAG